MISAAEAAALYVEPPYTLEEIEEAIRSRAVAFDFDVFKARRVTQEILKHLTDAGYTVTQSGGSDIVVSWKAKAA